MARPMREIICEECLNTFLSNGRNVKCCPACRSAHNVEVNRLYNERRRAERKSARKAAKYDAMRPKIKTISEVMADLAAYNKAHGTRLSYGEYVVMTNV